MTAASDKRHLVDLNRWATEDNLYLSVRILLHCWTSIRTQQYPRGIRRIVVLPRWTSTVAIIVATERRNSIPPTNVIHVYLVGVSGTAGFGCWDGDVAREMVGPNALELGLDL